jgi:hypothetical protein
MKTPEMGGQTPEKEEKLKIREIKVKNELPGLSGRSVDSFHGAIEDTKGLVVDVDTDKGVYELVALFAKYTTEKDKYAEEHQGGNPKWQLTDLKLINSSAKYGATYELVELNETVTDQLSEEIEGRFVDENGNWKA